MTDALKLGFSPFAGPAKGVLVVFCDDGLEVWLRHPEGARGCL